MGEERRRELRGSTFFQMGGGTSSPATSRSGAPNISFTTERKKKRKKLRRKSYDVGNEMGKKSGRESEPRKKEL